MASKKKMNPFKVLGIPNTSTISEIKIAYRRAASQNHPDLGGSHLAMVAVNAAYEELIENRSGRAHRTSTTSRGRSKTSGSNRTSTRTRTTKAQTDPAPTSSPINSPYWLSIYHELMSISQERGYKRGWVAYKLSQLRPPIKIWRLHAYNMGYKEGWVYHQIRL
jgi:preprotein translocase subunit Sec63